MSDPRKILLVEDNELNREMLTRRLKRAGLEVLQASNGEEALERMRSGQPDLVLMDMNLPVMDGWTACRHAKADQEIRHIPVVALTAHAMEADRLQAIAAGCDDYATKPIDFPQLLEKIDRLAGDC